MAKTIQLKRGTAAVLASVNPTPAAGEAIVETDTGKVKVGDGSTPYNSLPYTDDGNVKERAISSEEAINGAFSTETVQGDDATLVNMAQLRVLQTSVNAATHNVSGDVADANGDSLAAGENDGTTGTSLTAAKALNARVKALEASAVIDGGEITAPAGGE